MPTRPATGHRCARVRRPVAALLACIALACDVAEPDGAQPDELGDTTLDAGSLADDREAAIASAAERATVARAAHHRRADPAGTTDGAQPEAACREYCREYAAQCGDAGAFADDTACADACAAWSPGAGDQRGDSVSCRAAFLTAGRTSCIAAGPGSPLCVDATAGPAADDASIEAA
jgi:hypothetical protein